MIDNVTARVLDTIKKADLRMTNSLVSPVGTPNYFASVIDAQSNGYLVHCTDGVGSKVEHLIKHELHNTIGKDCFAMNYNDALCVNANPLSFQNHITSTQEEAHIIPGVIEGITDYCRDSFTLLTGGETEILQETSFHVSGSIIGTTNKPIDGSNVNAGDIIIGLKSSGVHSNGWTVIRKRIPELITKENLTPTKIYNKEIEKLLSTLDPSAIINVTGGGYRNLERIPNNLKYDLIIKPNDIFKELERKLTHQQLYTTFNCGYGMLVIVRPEQVDIALGCMEDSKIIGSISTNNRPQVLINGEDIYLGKTKPYVYKEKETVELGFSLTDN